MEFFFFELLIDIIYCRSAVFLKVLLSRDDIRALIAEALVIVRALERDWSRRGKVYKAMRDRM